MEDVYKKLGFKSSEILENTFGIRIYVGTKGKNDWCIVIPKVLCEMKCKNYPYDNPFISYCISESEVINLAKEYTELAMDKLGLGDKKWNSTMLK